MEDVFVDRVRCSHDVAGVRETVMVETRPETDEVPIAKVSIPEPVTRFVYTSETPRVYMDRSLVVEQGDVVEWPNGAPDVLWVPVTDSKEN